MMKGWSFLKIKAYPIQIIDGDRGTNYPTKEEFLQDGYCLFLNTGNVTLSGFNFDVKAFVTEEKHKKLRKGHLQRYDSILTTRGTIGNVAFYGDSIPYDVVRINSGMLILRPDQSKLNPRFFYGLLRSSIFQQQAELFRYGAAQPQLPITTLKHIRLPLPPLPIQQKIAGILSAYDDLIENNLKRIKLLEELAQITYEEWFVRLRFPGHESTPINPETNLPEGWENQKLAKLVNYIKRGISPKYVENDGIIVINQKCIRGNKVDLSVSRLTSAKKKIAPEKFVFEGDILVNSTGSGTLGRVAQYFYSDKICTVDSHVTIVRANTTVLSPYLLGRFFEHIVPFIENLGKGATNQQELSAKDMCAAIRTNVPPKELQLKFDVIAKPIYSEIRTLLFQNQRLREARDILLPRLMTGMIDVEQYDPAQLLEETV